MKKCPWCKSPIETGWRSFCRTQCARSARRHYPGMLDRARFLSLVTIDASGCHLWVGVKNRKGYGRLGRYGKSLFAHRYAFESAHGPIPQGLELDHLCRQTSCVRPKHLEAVAPEENRRRARRHLVPPGRESYCLRGHLFGPLRSGRRYCQQCNTERHREKRLATSLATKVANIQGANS